MTHSNWLPLNNVGVAFGRGPMVAFGGKFLQFKRTGAKAGDRCREVRGRSEVVASRRFLLHCFNGSSVGGSRVGRSREVSRFSEGSLREVSLYTMYIMLLQS